jgi:hypothetical protein
MVGEIIVNNLTIKIEESLVSEIVNEEIISDSRKFMPIGDNTKAFIQEARWMSEAAEAGQKMLNKIASPGFKKGNIPVGDLVKYLFGKGWSL